MAEWYLKEALRLLQEDQSSKKRRRNNVALAVRHLLSFLVGRLDPQPQNAVNSSDDSVCDHCFGAMQRAAIYDKCLRCREADRLARGTAKKARNSNKCVDNPGHEPRVVAHEKRVQKDLTKLEGKKKTTKKRKRSRSARE